MMPWLPSSILQQLVEVKQDPPTYDPDNGGQYIKGEQRRLPFEGTVLPLSEEDLRRAPQGTYTARHRKLYTKRMLSNGALVESASDTYTVTGVIDYGPIHPLRRYVIERKE